MVVHSFLVNTYARNVYVFGTKKLADIATEPDNYRDAVVKRGAELYSEKDLQESLKQGFITQEEYDETMAAKATLETK